MDTEHEFSFGGNGDESEEVTVPRVEAELIEEGETIASEKVTKPTRVFMVKSELYCDSITTNLFYEFCQIGRKKNQKVLYRNVDDFIARVKLVLPYSGERIENYCRALAKDNQVIDTQEASRIGEMTVTLWSDNYLQKGFTELIKGERGSPVKSALEAQDFCDSMKAQIGSGASNLVKLLK